MEKQEFLKQVGQQIKKKRLEKGISQVQLADLCERDKQSIERIESGKINTSIYMLHLIASALKIHLSEIVNVE